MIGGLYANLIIAAIFVGVSVGAYFTGDKNGAARVKAEYQARDLKTAEEAQAKYQALSEAYRAKEASWANQSAAVSKKYEGRLNALATNAAVAASVRLFDPSGNREACGDSAAKTAANPDATNSGGTELSKPFADFLKSEASRADRIVEKLNLCIGVLESERL